MLVLLDRDGVINEDLPQSVQNLESLKLLPRAAAAIALLKQAGMTLAIITNQSVVGRGIISSGELDDIHLYLHQLLAAEGARVDAVFTCTDHPDRATHRRKPGDGMLREALAQFNADPAQTPFVGDALRDLQAAASAGCPRYLVRTGKGGETEAGSVPDAVNPVTVCEDLYEAALHIIANYPVRG